jgi:adenosylcobyric acid synthase
MSGLLIAGTTSDAGKSIVTSGLCRAFARRGVRVAPFKSQNMSNNSMVVLAADGTPGEIGRAQWVQALAARVEPEVAMNPVLLKPGSDQRSHVVVRGRPAGEISSRDFVDGRAHLARTAYDAFDELSSRFEVVVAEGAGSPTEINLRASDYVNLGLAQHGRLPTILVGDIDRGGMFASMYGSVALLSADDQRLVAGFVVNRFRGDESLLAPGLAELESLTGRLVYGVLPFSSDVWLDSEDGLDVAGRPGAEGAPLRVTVVRSPRISNFTDIDALGLEPGVEVVYASDGRSLADADLVVLPGSRATLADLSWLRDRGLDRAVIAHAAAGRPVLGICGGFQMLGRTVRDPDGVEGPPGAAVAGLGLLDVETVFDEEKVLRLPRGTALGALVGGYEIHHGRVSAGASGEEFLGGVRDAHLFGTMWHGCLEHDHFRTAFLTEIARLTGHAWSPSGVSFPAARERRLDLLGDLVEHHLDIDALLDLARSGPPASLPVLSPGDRR